MSDMECTRCGGEMLYGTSDDGKNHKDVADCVAYQNKLLKKMAINLLQHQLLIDKLTNELDKVTEVLTKISDRWG